MYCCQNDKKVVLNSRNGTAASRCKTVRRRVWTIVSDQQIVMRGCGIWSHFPFRGHRMMVIIIIVIKWKLKAQINRKNVTNAPR